MEEVRVDGRAGEPSAGSAPPGAGAAPRPLMKKRLLNEVKLKSNSWFPGITYMSTNTEPVQREGEAMSERETERKKNPGEAQSLRFSASQGQHRSEDKIDSN